METEPKLIRIVIIDDHPVFLEGLLSLFSHDDKCEVVGTARSGKEALDIIPKLRPDIIIIDMMMPDMNAIEVIKAMKKQHLEDKIIIMSSYDSEEIIYQAFQQGAMAYLTKDALFDEVLECVRSVYNGQKLIPPPIALKLVNRVSRETLTEREIEVLKLLSEGLSNAEIAKQLHITIGTTKIHVYNIMSKLKVNARTSAVVEAIKRGLIQMGGKE